MRQMLPPEFREIRNKNHDFTKLCLNSELSSEITLQPIKRYDLTHYNFFRYFDGSICIGTKYRF